MENENKHHELSSTKPILKLTRDQISQHKSTESQRILSTHLYEVIYTDTLGSTDPSTKL